MNGPKHLEGSLYSQVPLRSLKCAIVVLHNPDDAERARQLSDRYYNTRNDPARFPRCPYHAGPCPVKRDRIPIGCGVVRHFDGSQLNLRSCPPVNFSPNFTIGLSSRDTRKTTRRKDAPTASGNRCMAARLPPGYERWLRDRTARYGPLI